MRTKVALGLAASLAVLVTDQASKAWVVHALPRVGADLPVLPTLDLTLVHNRGITFGLLNGPSGGVWLAAVALAIVGLLTRWLWQAEYATTAIALGAVAGGAVGNVADRVRLGYVVDFIRAHAFGWSWYVFNVADAAIVCGVIALVLEGVLRRRLDAAPPQG